MPVQKLIASAAQLMQPSLETAASFEAKSDFLAAEINRLMGSRVDLVSLIGEGNRDMMEDNHRNHVRFMSSVFQHFEPDVLVETVLWVFRAYRSHGFHLTYWPALLDLCIEIFRIHLSPSVFQEIYPFYRWMIVNQPGFVTESDKLID